VFATNVRTLPAIFFTAQRISVGDSELRLRGEVRRSMIASVELIPFQIHFFARNLAAHPTCCRYVCASGQVAYPAYPTDELSGGNISKRELRTTGRHPPTELLVALLVIYLRLIALVTHRYGHCCRKAERWATEWSELLRCPPRSRRYNQQSVDGIWSIHHRWQQEQVQIKIS